MVSHLYLTWVFTVVRVDMIMDAVLRHAQDVLAPYKDTGTGPPDPTFTLQLPDEVYSGSNLYAVQKTFRGKFHFDVFFDSPSVKQKLSCRPQYIYRYTLH